MNVFRFGDFGQTFLGLVSCICWINDQYFTILGSILQLALAPPPPNMHLNIDHLSLMLNKKVIFVIVD